MARYFLQVRQEHNEALDDEGVEIASLAALKATVLKGARDSMSQDLREGRLVLNLRIDAEDEAGAVVYSLSFDEALRASYG